MKAKLRRFNAFRRGWTDGAGTHPCAELDADYERGYARGEQARLEALEIARARLGIPPMPREELLHYTEEELLQHTGKEKDA
jgi:hypothetical protein